MRDVVRTYEELSIGFRNYKRSQLIRRCVHRLDFHELNKTRIYINFEVIQAIWACIGLHKIQSMLKYHVRIKLDLIDQRFRP